ncbi:MAG: hypothetical protein R3A10_20825 [Caldilineaceae bacterium]
MPTSSASAGAEDGLIPASPARKVVDFALRAIVHGHGKAVIAHVEHQVLAHDGQPDEADIRCIHAVASFVCGGETGWRRWSSC